MKARTLNTILKGTSALLAALLAASGAAQAGQAHGDGFTTRAKVLASTPVYETINEPRRECWTETVGHETRSVRDGSNTGGAILGAIAGGLIGSTVGKGDGKVAAAVGAATGAVVGDRWNDGGTRYESRPRQVERCRTHDDYRQVVSGYDVRYRFQDREYSTRLPYDPGKWLTLNVSFSVAEDQRGERWNNSRNDWKD
ncbi:MAG: glycine zipper 2TM domain-containing protein [Thiobacillus sp.]|nr:glycine zipper 2TM domain-containing protein [Thiobacillus sp.]